MKHFSFLVILRFIIYFVISSKSLASGETNSCALTNLPTGLSYDVDWGDPSSTSFNLITCLTVTNDHDVSRHEVAYSSIPIPESLDLQSWKINRLVVVGANNKRIPAQFEVISRWKGSVTSTSLPIKWLQIAIPVNISASTNATYHLRLYSTSQARSVDAVNDVFISTSGIEHTISTGSATGAEFVLREDLPRLLKSLNFGPGNILSPSSTGPSITFIPQSSSFGTSPITLDSSDAQVNYFEITEHGPVKATVLVEGQFSASNGASLCKTFNSYYFDDYESFTYSLALSFSRGSANIKVQYHVRNECSYADGSDWTDQTFLVDKASYSLNFSDGVPATSQSNYFYAGPSESSVSSGDAAGTLASLIVEQKRGRGSTWRRRARVLFNGSVVSNTLSYDRPMVAISNGSLLVGATMSYMRFREPQAVRINGSELSLDVISEQQRLGEGKGIWSTGIFFVSTVNTNERDDLQLLRLQAISELERGLLLHTPRQHYSESGAMPPLGYESSLDSPIKSSYIAMMDKMHSHTLEYQWNRAKTFGSQIWPDIQFDVYNIDNSSPADNNPRQGYWNPHAHELLEFFRSGNPKWVHDFALPLSWLMAYTAYLNIGRQTHDVSRSGLCVTNGGSGDGQWHRSGFGSDDYMYNLAMKYAYILRPDPIHRRRIEITGRTVFNRYPRSTPQANRDPWLEKLDVARGVLQHMEAGINCSEFGKEWGDSCNTWFLQVMSEFITDNLSTGSICQPDQVSGTTCPQAQTFMQVSMMYDFFVRVYLHYGDIDGGLLKAIHGIPEGLFNYAIDRSGTSINYRGNHAYALDCTTNSARTTLTSCVFEDTGDGLYLYEHNINSLLSVLLIGYYFKPSSALNYCDIVSSAWSSQENIINTWETVVGNNAGWLKGTSQMMSLMAHGVGMIDYCNSNNNPTSSPIPVTSSPSSSITTWPPSSIPTLSPSSNPTFSPLLSPTSYSPTRSMIPTNQFLCGTEIPSVDHSRKCDDSPLKFKINIDNKDVFHDCKWVRDDPESRCGLNKVKWSCPESCGVCDTCKDSRLKFKLFTGDKVLIRSCKHVARHIEERCKYYGIDDTCRKTCSRCEKTCRVTCTLC